MTQFPAGDEHGDAEASEPALRVVRGEPSDEEIAALVTALAVLPGRRAEPQARLAPSPTRWSDHRRYLRSCLPYGSGQWRASGLP